MEDNEYERHAIALGLKDLSLIDRARALCVAADDVQRATIEASRRIAAIHGNSPKKRKRRNKTASGKSGKEPPPDICARPPSDIPPPRGEGWRRLDSISVVRGSNRICAPARSRRALTRGVEIFLGGGRYCIVPADIDPGGGFCVTLNRDFEGESNMACMLYLRRRQGREVAVTGDRKQREEALTITPTIKVKSPCSTYPSLSASVHALGEQRLAARGGSPLRMFTVGMEHEHGIFNRLRQENNVEGGESSTAREAQRRARQRALHQRRREIGAAKAKEDVESTKEPLNAADVERLKATRRVALARVVSVKQQEACRRESQSKKIDEERRRIGAEAAAKATVLQATALARAAKVVAANRQRKLEHDLALQEEARLKRERVATVLGHDQANVSEREKRVRNETCRRIRREEKRRELALRREEDERLEKIRLHEGRQRMAARCIPPTVKSARSFFSVSDPADRQVISSEKLDEDIGPTTVSSTWRAPDDESSSRRPVEMNQRGSLSEIRDARVDSFILDPGMCVAESHREKANQPCYNHSRQRFHQEKHERSSLPSLTEHAHGSTHCNNDGATGLRYGNAKNSGGIISNPGLELPSTSPSCGTGSASASGASIGSNGSNKSRRKRIPTKPVWKRPAVPLSKPYVPVPRKECVFASA